MKMKNTFEFIISIVCFIAITQKGNCQLAISSPNENMHGQFFVSIGLEPELVSTIGYMHKVGDTKMSTKYYAGASLKFDQLLIKKGAWRGNLLTAADYRISDKWGTRPTLNIYLAHDNNRAAIMNGLGFELRSAFIRYGKRNKGIDVGWQYTALTHIKNSAATKDTYNDRYPSNQGIINGPTDGWYAGTASRLRLGFVSSVKLSKQTRLQLGAGSLINVQKQAIIVGFSHAQVPVYVESILSVY